MKVEHLPWESLEGPIFHAKELKPRKAWVTYGCWFMCVLLIIGGLTTRYKIALIFGVLYILTLLMKKDVVVTERGVEIYYQMRIATHYDFWPWKEIFSVIREEKKGEELVAVYFSRGDRNKRLFFTKADAKQIMVLARKKNSTAVVSDAAPTQSRSFSRKKPQKK